MLKGIPKIVSPELLKIPCEMGHGDEIVITDANFPSASLGQRIVRADGIDSTEMLKAILSLIPLDQYDNEHFILMEKCKGDRVDTEIWNVYKKVLKEFSPNSKISFLDRFDYYERAKKLTQLLRQDRIDNMQILFLKKDVFYHENKCNIFCE